MADGAGLAAVRLTELAARLMADGARTRHGTSDGAGLAASRRARRGGRLLAWR
ncbi:MAG: hypothetical protein R3B48_21735 [Kofleriaceae bacterium]